MVGSTISSQPQQTGVTSEVESLSQLTEDPSSSATPVGLATIFRPRNDKYDDTTSTDESQIEDGNFPNESTDTIGELVSVKKAVDNMIADSKEEDTHYDALEPTMTSNSSLLKSVRKKKKKLPPKPERNINDAHDLDSYLDDVSISSWSSRSYYKEPEYDPLTTDSPSPKRSSSSTSSVKKAALKLDKHLASTIAQRSDPAGDYKSMPSSPVEDISPGRPITEKEKRTAVALTCPPRPWWTTPENSFGNDDIDSNKSWLVRNRGYVLCFMVFCFVAATTISLSLLFTNRDASTGASQTPDIGVAVDGQSPSQTTTPTPSTSTSQPFTSGPTDEPLKDTDVPTASPSAKPLPTSFPTAFPTLAPTTRSMGLKDWILQLSPESQAALSVPFTDQSMAMEAMQGQRPDIERYSLLTLKYAFNMSNLDATLHVCRWEGVTCDSSLMVIMVDWSFSALEGTLPAEVGLLSKLKVLNLAGSSSWGGDMVGGLHGTLPETIGRLTNLQELILYDSGLFSTIPTSLFQATSLTEIQLSGNSLTGTLSSAVGNLTNLRILDLGSNEFRGFMPKQLGHLSRLQHLNLRNNELTGSIPDSFRDLDQLQELFLDENTLYGSIPPSLFELSSLGWLAMNDNRLNGFIPNDVGLLSNLEGFEVQHNRFRGFLPGQLATLDKMRVLDVSHNFFTGSVPSTLGVLPLLAHLSLDHNRFNGEVPLSLCDMTVAGGPLIRLEADCGEISCSCCTRCYNVD